MEKRKQSDAELVGLTNTSLWTSVGYGVATGWITGEGFAHDHMSLLLNIPLSIALGALAHGMFSAFAMDKSFIRGVGQASFQQNSPRQRIHLVKPMVASVITGAALGTLSALTFREGVNTLPIDTNVKGFATTFEWALPIAAISRLTWIQGREMQRMQNSRR